MAEKDIEREIRAVYEALGCLVIKMNIGPVKTAGGLAKNKLKGFPDLLVVTPQGQPFWSETKDVGARVNKEHAASQSVWQDRLRAFNVPGIQTCDPKEAEMFASELIIGKCSVAFL